MADNSDSAYEYFVSFKLSSDNRDYRWDPTVVEKDFVAEKDDIRHSLHLTQVILDVASEEGDMNIIELQTTSIEGNPMVTPLAFLKAGTMYQTKIDVELPNSDVTFSLKKGSGPVHIIGLHTVTISVPTAEDENDEEDVDDPETAEEETELSESKKNDILAPIEVMPRRMSTRSMDPLVIQPSQRRMSVALAQQPREPDEVVDQRRKSSTKEVEAVQRRKSSVASAAINKEPEVTTRRKSSAGSRRSTDPNVANGEDTDTSAIPLYCDKKRKSGTGEVTGDDAKSDEVNGPTGTSEDVSGESEGGSKKIKLITEENELAIDEVATTEIEPTESTTA